jgi:hypothetical protein
MIGEIFTKRVRPAAEPPAARDAGDELMANSHE